MGYPTGALHRLLLLTGMRVNEAAQPAVVGVYDFHQYADEKREALELSTARRRSRHAGRDPRLLR
jgi:hypothetical protein